MCVPALTRVFRVPVLTQAGFTTGVCVIVLMGLLTLYCCYRVVESRAMIGELAAGDALGAAHAAFSREPAARRLSVCAPGRAAPAPSVRLTGAGLPQTS